MNQKSKYELYSTQAHSKAIRKCEISADGKWGITISDDCYIHFWDLGNYQKLFSLKAPYSVLACALSFDKNFLYTSAYPENEEQHVILIWDLTTQQILDSLIGHTASIRNLIISHNQKFLISTSREGEIFIWNLITRQIEFTFDKDPLKFYNGNIPFTLGIESCVLSSDDQFLLTTSGFGRVLLWSIPLKKNIASFRWTQNPPWLRRELNRETEALHEAELFTDACAFSHDDKWILVSFGNGTIYRVDKNTMQDIQQYQNPPRYATACEFTKGDTFFIVNAKNKILIWETFTGQNVIILEQNSKINDLAILPDQTRFISGDQNGILKIWNLEKIIEEYIQNQLSGIIEKIKTNGTLNQNELKFPYFRKFADILLPICQNNLTNTAQTVLTLIQNDLKIINNQTHILL